MRSDAHLIQLRRCVYRAVVSALVLGLTAVAGGCRSSRGQALAPALAGNDAQIDFWHSLPQRHPASNDEAFHALLLFTDSRDDAADYGGRVALLWQKHMLPDGFSAPAEEGVRRGTLAVALVRALSIKGGLTLRVFGDQPRYAVRELEYVGVFPPSSPQQTFSGAELLGIIGRAEDFQRDSTPGAAKSTPDGAGEGTLDAKAALRLGIK